MTALVDSAQYKSKSVSRRCDICGMVIEADCYPRTGENQHRARNISAEKLEAHLKGEHGLSELISYVMKIHGLGR